MPESHVEIHLKSRPVGFPKESDFEIVETERPVPEDGQMLVRNIYMSVDPYMRGRMRDVKSYTPPFQLGRVMDGGSLGQVVSSTVAGFSPGDCVLGGQGWRQYYVTDGSGQRKIDGSLAPLPAFLGTLGMPGMTAYVGLLDIGKPQEGETVFVSAAAGAVGSVVGQIAKIHGCRVVGSAGSSTKVEYLIDELGFDDAFNYKEVDMNEALSASCPDGIDIYFENVGGATLEAVLNHMRPFGRIPVCGMIAQYNLEEPAPGPKSLIQVIPRRLTLTGFIVSDSFDRLGEFQSDMSTWISEGRVKSRQTLVEGIEAAPAAFLGLLQGENLGKMLVQISPESLS
jgi:NADPH-dependent curcumin reductase CurA